MQIKPTEPPRPKKNIYKFSTGQANKQIIISSNFDSGNIQLVKQINEFQYRLAAVPDDGRPNPKKCWFYFKVKVPDSLVIRFIIQNVNVLYPAYQSGVQPSCVYKEEDKAEWKTIPSMFLTVKQIIMQMNEDTELVIEHYFKTCEFVYFALTVPFSYYDQVMYLQNLDDVMLNKPDIYYNRQILTKSTLGFDVFLLTISQKQQYTEETFEDKINDKMFPDNKRSLKIKKPVVFLNCRVHPGQVTASHTLNGMIEFLCSNDIRAYLLRKLFVFVIVPMVNPDGVYLGNYRMNSSGVNLNRVYNLATPEDCTQIFAIKSLVEYYNQDGRLQFYFDMHGHSSVKGAFIYGSAFDNIVSQVESELFCKIFDLNSQYFNFSDCSFSEKHMVMKDKNQPLSKQGCSRVVLGKLTGIVNCLTLETGMYKVSPSKQLVDVGSKQYTYKEMKINNYKISNFTDIFCQIGRGLLISILDRIQKNPFSRLPNTSFKNLQGLRKVLAFEVLNNQQRFKMLDMKAYHKVKYIAKHAHEVFTDKIYKKWIYLQADSQFQNIQWPNNFQGFKLKFLVKEKKQNKQKQRQKQQRQMSLKPIIKSRYLSQPKLESASLSKKLIKTFSPTQKIERQAMIAQQQIANRIIQPIQIIFSEQNQGGKRRINRDRSLTRKLLRDFSNEREKLEYDSEQRSKLKIVANPISIISQTQDQLMIQDFKQRMNSKIQIRKNYTMLKKGLTRVRTDVVQDAKQLLVVSHKRLPKCLQTVTQPSEETLNDEIQEPNCELQDLQQKKLKKIKEFKKQILGKFPEIKKRTSLKFPEIRRSYKKQDPLNLQQLRKDIQSVKLISVTSYLTKQKFN